MITSVGEMHSVNCCWATKIYRPPWIGFIIRYRTPWYIVLVSMRLTNTVIGQTGYIASTGVIRHTALISWSVQCCVVR